MACVRCEIINAKVAFFMLHHVRGLSADQVAAELNNRFATGEVYYWVDRESFVRRSPTKATYYMGCGVEIGKLNAT